MFLHHRCLDESGGVILSEPERASKIIVSCAVLHNICVQNNLPLRQDQDWDGQQRPRRRRARVGGEVFAPAGRQLQMMDPNGAIVRQRLIDTRFRL